MMEELLSLNINLEILILFYEIKNKYFIDFIL